MSDFIDITEYLMTATPALRLLLAAGIACAFTAMAMPFVVFLGRCCGLVDQPDARRKQRQEPIPRVGGLAMVAGAMGAWACLGLVGGLQPLPHQLWVALGLLIVVIVGVADDGMNLRGRHKLVGQVFAAMLIVMPGKQALNTVQFMGAYASLEEWGIPLTMLIFVGAMNAANLLDGMDGFLGSVALSSGCALLALAVSEGQTGAAMGSSIFGGTVAGFLIFNRPPAKVYLGDCGSMLVGTVLAMLAISTGHREPDVTWVSLAVPVGVLFLPIVDTSAAIIRRSLTGRSLYSPDRSHVHHCLVRAGLGPWRAMALAMAIGLVVGLFLMAAHITRDDRVVWLIMAMLVTTLIWTGLFGRAEYRLIYEQVRALVAHRPSAEGRSDADMSLHLQGCALWDPLWRDLVAVGRMNGVAGITLDIDMPWLGESFHAHWNSGHQAADQEVWRVDIPIVAQGRVIAHFHLESYSLDKHSWQILAQFQPYIDRVQVLALALEPERYDRLQEVHPPLMEH